MCSSVALPALCQVGVTLRFYLDKQASHTLAYVQEFKGYNENPHVKLRLSLGEIEGFHLALSKELPN